jgi:hypothetical protein
MVIHPGIGFPASIGCVNPCIILSDSSEPISVGGRRNRVLAFLDALRDFLIKDFPTQNGRRSHQSTIVIEGEP